MDKLYRTTFIPGNGFGTDSIQGWLEFSLGYDRREWEVSCGKNDTESHSSPYFMLNQLKSEGYLYLEWETRKDGGHTISQLSLTVDGHKLLDELKLKSKSGTLKKRITDLSWVVVTTICTTLLVLKIKGL